MNRWWWIPVVIGAAIAALGLTAVRASADDLQDELFLDSLHQHGISSAYGDSGLIVAGRQVCASFAVGTPYRSVVSELSANNPALGIVDAAVLTGVAVAAYCEQYKSMLARPRMQEAI